MPTHAQDESPSSIPEAAEAVADVEAQYRAGYDGVKIYNQVSGAEYPFLVKTAKSHNMIVIGHVARELGFIATLAAGQGASLELPYF